MSAMRYGRAFGFVGLLILSAPAQAADFDIDNLKLELGKVVIAVPKISVKGSSLEREQFMALFDGKTGESAVSRMAKLDAGEISASELVIEQQMGPQRQVTTYRGLRFTDVRQGRIGNGEAASADIAVTGSETGPMKGTMARTSFTGFDLRQTARVLTEKAEPGVEEKPLPLFERFQQDGYSFDMGKGGRMSLGKSQARHFAAKRGEQPLGDVLTQFITQAEQMEKTATVPKPERTPEQRENERKFGLAMVQMFEMFEYGSGDAVDFKMSMPVPVEPAKGKDSPTQLIDLTIARIAYGEDTPAKSGYIVEGMTFSGKDARGGIGSYSQSGFVFGPVLKELRTILSNPDFDPETMDWRKLVPTLGTTRMEGLQVDATIDRGPNKGEPVSIGIGLFELKAGEQFNGIPTSLALTLDKLTMPVTPTPGNTAMRDLIDMGYKTLDLSAKIDLAWDQATNTIALRTLSFGGAGIGRFDATGTIGNTTKELFASDLALAQVAALGATVRNVQARLRNDGLIEKLIENQARKTKRKVEAVRQEYAMIANLGLSAILGPSDAAKTLTSAISRFAAKPGTLSVEATAKSPSGIGLADVITMTDPTEIFDKIDLKADAN